MVHPDDARDLNLHRVIDNFITQARMQFGMTREETVSRFEAFIELEREEMEESARARRAIDTVLDRESDRA